MSPRLGDRKHPRVRSFRLRPLWWVVTREAVLRIQYASELNAAASKEARSLLLHTRGDSLVDAAERLIAREPWRRFWPRRSPAPTKPPPSVGNCPPRFPLR